jgi:hypothetical protein
MGTVTTHSRFIFNDGDPFAVFGRIHCSTFSRRPRANNDNVVMVLCHCAITPYRLPATSAFTGLGCIVRKLICGLPIVGRTVVLFFALLRATAANVTAFADTHRAEAATAPADRFATHQNTDRHRRNQQQNNHQNQ